MKEAAFAQMLFMFFHSVAENKIFKSGVLTKEIHKIVKQKQTLLYYLYDFKEIRKSHNYSPHHFNKVFKIQLSATVDVIHVKQSLGFHISAACKIDNYQQYEMHVTVTDKPLVLTLFTSFIYFSSFANDGNFQKVEIIGSVQANSPLLKSIAKLQNC